MRTPETTIAKPAHWSYPEARNLDAVLSNIAAIGAAIDDDRSKQILRDIYRAVRKDIGNYQMKYEIILGMWEGLAYPIPADGVGVSKLAKDGPFMPKWK